MASFFSRMKDKLSSSESDTPKSGEEGYVEVGADTDTGNKSKIIVRPYIIEDFEHIKPILDVLREGRTIALINIKPLRDKDIVELKRAINKLKKTCDAIEGDIAGFGDEWIAVTPSFATIYRKKETSKEQQPVSEVSEYSDEP